MALYTCSMLAWPKKRCSRNSSMISRARACTWARCSVYPNCLFRTGSGHASIAYWF